MGSQIELVVYAVLGGVLILYLFAMTGMVCRRQRAAQSVRVNLPQCRGCGYSIVDARSARCPECGSQLSRVGLRRVHARRGMRLPTKWGLWTVIALSLVWPVQRVLSSSAPDLAAGWWESSFLLAREAVSHKDRMIEEPINVSLVCSQVGKIGASVLPHRVLVVINQHGVTSRALLVDARAGEFWIADLDWVTHGPARILTTAELASSLKESISHKGLWLEVEDEVVVQHANFIHNFIASLQAVKLDPLSPRSPWPHPSLSNQPILEDGQAQRVAPQHVTWLVSAAWFISGVVWLSGGHLIWLRSG